MAAWSPAAIQASTRRSAVAASGVRMWVSGSAPSWSRNCRSGQNRWLSPPLANTTTRRSSPATAEARSSPASRKSSGSAVWHTPIDTQRSSPWRKPSS